ncbi:MULTISPECIES: GAF and ANTAR domain-containing protein [unclassified Rhodococcus (in: high G+C Gram-positive bacteria)]|uniref:GAF and ANTAR domain-containing protein n=1 Tax=unclassified Rhodococcus (in: high G+C Gram-positive bacteria) TaxID=192944 RepID=UPI00163B3436|nr:MULTISPECIES: GAF and ANTAR domain-containing protein [unclassified Rhodococcus (in: high G+C Gram-positive bacteria)]MBC2644375.1 GAF and ANTAR domain-containing protein [Rhodococcus sp. 3A]MBC2897933.1 GAF and ANTAR domain-containing protein [Rhodococcus sp. 4CII]
MTSQRFRTTGPSPTVVPAGGVVSSDAMTAALVALAGCAVPVPDEVLDRTLERVCASASVVLRTVGGVDAVVSVTGLGVGRPRCVVTDETVRVVEQAQYAAGAGPGERAAHERRRVQARIGEYAQAWPAFTAAAREAGFGEAVAVPVFADGDPDQKVVGVVGAYTRASGGEGIEDARWWAGLELVTTTVSATLSEARRRRALAGVLAQLRRGVSSKAEVDRAIGVLMAAHAVSDEQAAVILSELAEQDSPHHSVQAAARRVLRLCIGE